MPYYPTMLAPEAKWIARVVTALPPEAFPLLNVGSHTREFRERDQPMIDSQIFAPLRIAGRSVVHTDIREGDGVDVTGDLTDEAFRAGLVSEYGIRSILCCNVLEHVPDPLVLAASLAHLVDATSGHLIVTVPRSFPYHPDPIDTMFRPSRTDLARMVAPLVEVSSTEMRAGTLPGYVVSRAFHGFRSAVHSYRTGGSTVDMKRPPRTFRDLTGYLVRPFVVTCGWYRSDPKQTNV
jgi:hypothetical protein